MTRGDAGRGEASRGAPAPGTVQAQRPDDGLRIHHRELRRGGRIVLREGTLHAPGGAVVALVGENGAGKSTLLMSTAGVLLGGATGAGTTIALDGHAVDAISYLPQRPALPPWLTVRQGAVVHGADASLLEEGAARLGMATLLERRPADLSGGQLQALAAVIALARAEPVVLLDEPFTAVDLTRRPVLRQLVTERAARVPRGVVILSSHVAADLAVLCDWVVVLRDGGYLFQGTPRALASHASAPGDAPHEVGDASDDSPPDADALERAVGALFAPAAHPRDHSPL